MKEPNGMDLLATLIELLADQEGVIITYELVDKDGNLRKVKTSGTPKVHPSQR